jgi:uncharacterized protein
MADRRFDMRNAGGSPGGGGHFFLGLVLMIAGGYTFLRAVHVWSGFGWGGALFAYGGFGVSGGTLLIPLLIGIAMIFYNANGVLGWVVMAGSLLALGIGIVSSIHFTLAGMSLFDLILILGLFMAGLGLFLRSLRAVR